MLPDVISPEIRVMSPESYRKSPEINILLLIYWSCFVASRLKERIIKHLHRVCYVS